MDVSKITKKITKKTKAVMAVHIYNLPIDMNKLQKICKEYNLILIEDAAEQIGQNLIIKWLDHLEMLVVLASTQIKILLAAKVV